MKCNGKYYREIVWLRNKERIVEQQPDRFSSPGSGSLLFITKVTMADSGSYVCQFVSLRLAYRDVELLVVGMCKHVFGVCVFVCLFVCFFSVCVCVCVHVCVCLSSRDPLLLSLSPEL